MRLDDRFLSQNEFWDAIVEHPSLINGPIVETANDANLCDPKSGLGAFLKANFPHSAAFEEERAKIKQLPPNKEAAKYGGRSQREAKVSDEGKGTQKRPKRTGNTAAVAAKSKSALQAKKSPPAKKAAKADARSRASKAPKRTTK